MNTDIVYGYAYKNEIREMFSVYTDMLVENEPRFKKYLSIQNYEDELKDLEKKYGLPEGRLYIALCGNAPAGCIALRKLDSESCELKRLYVYPAYRRQGLGRSLVEKIIAEARAIGYKHIYLDTLPFLKTAAKMYYDLGFYDIPKYNDSPLDTTIYMKLDL